MKFEFKQRYSISYYLYHVFNESRKKLTIYGLADSRSFTSSKEKERKKRLLVTSGHRLEFEGEPSGF